MSARRVCSILSSLIFPSLQPLLCSFLQSYWMPIISKYIYRNKKGPKPECSFHWVETSSVCPECEDERWMWEERGFGQIPMFLSWKEVLSSTSDAALSKHQSRQSLAQGRKARNYAPEWPRAWFSGWQRLEPFSIPSRVGHCWTLTHPDFPKLPCAKLFHQLNGLPGDLPGIFIPWLLRFGTDACLLQSSA